VQAGSEVSGAAGPHAFCGGIPAEPEIRNRRTARTHHFDKKQDPITSVQAIYVPADDYTDPAPAATFAHLDATTNLSRQIVERGIYPAVDPLASFSRILDPAHRGTGSLQCGASGEISAPALQGIAGHHRDLGIEELSDDDKQTVDSRTQDRKIPVAAP